MKKLLLFTFLFVLFSLTTFADSANVGGVGNTVEMIESQDIKMLDEDIQIDVYTSERYAEGYGTANGYIEVDVVYTFKNLTDEEVLVTMGFPEDCNGYCSYEVGGREYEESEYGLFDFYKLIDFAAYEGGEPLDITFEAGAEEEGKNWYIYHVAFAPNEEKEISNTYWIVPTTYYTFDSFKYILETGSSWADDIDSVDIDVVLHDGLTVYDIDYIEPTGFEFDRTNNSVSWRILNIEPDEWDNVSLSYLGPDEVNTKFVNVYVYDALYLLGIDESLVSDIDGSKVTFTENITLGDYNPDMLCGYASSCLDPEVYENRLYLYLTEMAQDNQLSSSWVEGVSGDGIGEWLEVGLQLERSYEKMRIFNGYGTDETIWEENNRIKKAKLIFSNGEERIIELQDVYDYQTVDINPPIGNVDSVKVEIMEVYEGSKYDDTAIAELDMQGVIVDDEGFVEDLFSDVPSSHANYSAINYLHKNDIVHGYPDGSFKPDDSINRAELMTLAVAMKVGDPGDEYGNCFPDVNDEWFASYVCYAYENGFVDGYPDGYFRPANNANRVEAIKIILNNFYETDETGYWPKFATIPTSEEDIPLDVYMDTWYFPIIVGPLKYDLLDFQHVQYVDSGFNYFPGENMTRKEVAQFIYNLMDFEGVL